MAAVKTAPTIVRANGSHWLELEKTSRGDVEPFAREELYPILELEAPRVGLVRVSFEVSRYVASSWDERTQESSPLWTGWRILLRDVRTPDPDKPELPHLGREATGVGPATRKTISDKCEPIIREWLAGDEYQRSRRKAAAQAVRRELDAPRDYQLEGAKRILQRVARANLIGPMEADHISETLEHLERAAAGLNRDPLAD